MHYIHQFELYFSFSERKTEAALKKEESNAGGDASVPAMNGLAGHDSCTDTINCGTSGKTDGKITENCLANVEDVP